MIHLQQSFNGGQMGPFLQNRADIDKFKSGLRQSLNSIPTPYGPTRRRPGTLYIGNVKDNTSSVRLVNFDINSDDGFILELGNKYVRFYHDQDNVEVNPDPWAITTIYPGGETVESGGVDYVCLASHTSAALTEPGTGAEWEDYWYALAAAGDVSTYELPTPYLDGDLKQIQIAQVNDTMYLVHPDYPVQIISRYSIDQWTLAELVWTWPPVRDLNIDTAHTMTPSATTGTITITSSTPYFDALMEGGYMQFDHKRGKDDWSAKQKVVGASSSIVVRGDYQFRTGGTWTGTVIVEESDTGAFAGEEVQVRSFTATADDNFVVTLTTDGLKHVRVNVTAFSALTNAFASVEAIDAFVKGWAKITEYTSTTLVTATVGSPMFSSNATNRWSDGAFSDLNGHPRAVTLHELRLCLGGTEADRNTVWASRTDDFPNFEPGDTDTHAWRYSLASTEHNTINWMASQKQLLIGSSGGEWVLDSGKEEAVITPTNRRARRQTNFGSEHLQALAVDSSTLFIRSGAERMADFAYVFEQDGYDSADLNLLSYDLTRGGIIETAYQRKRDPMIWVVINGGSAACMAYNRRQAVTGWSPIKSPGASGNDIIESVAVVGRAGDEDEVWFVVKRVINGFTVRYLEVLDPDSYDKQEDATYYEEQGGLVTDTGTNLEDLVFLDSSVYGTVAASGGSTVVSGLDHLVGMDVVAYADGSRQGDLHSVNGSGEITIDGEFTQVLVGMKYLTRGRTLPLFNSLKTGSTRSREQYIHKTVWFVHRSGPFKVYIFDDPNDPETVTTRPTSILEGDPTPLRDGEFEMTMGGRTTLDPSVAWETDEPTPLTIEALAIKHRVEGE